MHNNILYIITLILAVFLFGACKSKSLISSSPDVIKIDQVYKDEPIKPLPTKDKKVERDTIADVIKDVKPKIVRKEVYEIAIALPFQEEIFKQNYFSSKKENLEDFKITDASNQSISFLQGVMFALTNENINSKFKITLYDLGTSEVELDLAINKMNLSKPDIIVGATTREQVVQISNFSQKNKIPFFSPFVPASNIVTSNSYYIMLEPGIEVHLKEIASYIADTFLKENIIILHENNAQSRNFADITEAYFNIFKQDISSTLQKVEVATNAGERRNFAIDKYLKPDVNNIIFIPSFNEGFLHAMLTNINAQAQRRAITVFGMPTWEDAETLQFRHFNTLNLHLTKGNWLNSYEVDDFNKYFLKNYEKIANQNAFYGYESVKLIDELFENYGLHFIDKITNQNYKGIIRDYSFQTVVNEQEEVVRYENTSLKVVEIENFELKLKR